MAPGPAARSHQFLSVRHLNLKSIALLTGLAILVALAGCGGSSGSSTAGVETTAPIGKAEATVKSPTPEHKAANKQQQKQQQPAELSDKQVEKKIHELAKSGKPIPANSPVAKQIVAALTSNNGKNKKGKKGAASIVEKLEEVVSPSQNGGSNSGSGGQGNAPSAGVEKILEQIQK